MSQIAPAIPPARTIAAPVCVVCGYALDGLEEVAHCPECGGSLDLSRRLASPQACDGAFLRSLARCARVVAWCSLATGLLASILFLQIDQPGLLPAWGERLLLVVLSVLVLVLHVMQAGLCQPLRPEGMTRSKILARREPTAPRYVTRSIVLATGAFLALALQAHVYATLPVGILNLLKVVLLARAFSGRFRWLGLHEPTFGAWLLLLDLPILSVGLVLSEYSWIHAAIVMVLCQSIVSWYLLQAAGQITRRWLDHTPALNS